MRSLRTLEWLTECRVLCQPACYRLQLSPATTFWSQWATSLAGEARLDRWSGWLGCRDNADSCSSVAEVWDAGSPEPGLQLTSSSSNTSSPRSSSGSSSSTPSRPAPNYWWRLYSGPWSTRGWGRKPAPSRSTNPRICGYKIRPVSPSSDPKPIGSMLNPPRCHLYGALYNPIY